MTVTTKEAVTRLTEALKTDPAYRATWVANLSMTFYDSLASRNVEREVAINAANEAAENFLKLLEAP